MAKGSGGSVAGCPKTDRTGTGTTSISSPLYPPPIQRVARYQAWKGLYWHLLLEMRGMLADPLGVGRAGASHQLFEGWRWFGRVLHGDL